MNPQGGGQVLLGAGGGTLMAMQATPPQGILYQQLADGTLIQVTYFKHLVIWCGSVSVKTLIVESVQNSCQNAIKNLIGSEHSDSDPKFMSNLQPSKLFFKELS